jgi:1,2-diacylglycerol 3-beta-galactosyltransferase
MGEKKRILILTADAGFGHRSAANAIAAAFHDAYADCCVVEIANPLDDKHVPPFLRDTQTDYDKIVRQMPDFYKLNFQISDGSVPVAVIDRALIVLLIRVIRMLIRDFNPDVIVTTYMLYMAPLDAYITLSKLPIPFITVVTDLTNVHRIWFNQGADLCLLPTEEAYEQALSSGLPPEILRLTGIPVNPAIAAETREKSVIRADLGWAPDITTALVVGSKRVRNLMSFLNVLNHAGFQLQFVLVAGGDDDLYAQFKATEWHSVTQIYNYTDRMPQFMHASDLIIGKAGGLTVTEALACGLPLLFVDVTPGQEEGNAAYALGHGAGELAHKPVDALEILFHWLYRDHRLLDERARNALALGRPRSAYAVAELAWQAAEQGRSVPTSRLLAWVPKFKELLKTFEITVTEDN